MYILRLVDAGEQGGDDVLAPAAPVVGTAARCIRAPCLIEGDANVVGGKIAARHLRLEHGATPGYGEHGSLSIIVLALAHRLWGRVFPDQVLVKFKRLHSDNLAGR